MWWGGGDVGDCRKGRRVEMRGVMGLKSCNGGIAYRHRGGLLMRMRVCRGGGWTQVGGVRSSSSVGGWTRYLSEYERQEPRA